MDIKEIIRKYALKNALDYGKANWKAVVGKVVAEAKVNAKEVIPLIKEVVNEVNKMKKEDIENEVRKFSFQKPRKDERISIPNPQDGVITRFPPEPSGYLHIGHAKAVFLDYVIAEQYNGFMRLRFDDTNPKKESQEYVDAIKEDLEWLGVKWRYETYTSDYMPMLYEKARELIQKGFLYVTTAKKDEIKRSRETKVPLKERSNSVEDNLELWDKMLANEFDEGEAVVLLKGDLNSANTVMRDPTMFRIIKTEHYRQRDKYIVWPSYDFEAPILDAHEGVTHAIRSKEYELRTELYYRILDLLDLRKPTLIHISRLSIKGTLVSKRFLTPLVKEKKVWGWDDPRLPTIRGLRRRGIVPEAIRNFALRFGIGKQEKIVGWEFLLKENRKVLDKKAKRFFFVPDPVNITVKGLKEGEVEIKLHPDLNVGFRRIKYSSEIFIPRSDFDVLKEGDVIRLKDLVNIKLLHKEKGMFEITDEKPFKKVQWISVENVPISVYVPKDLVDEEGNFNPDSLDIIKGLAEVNIDTLREDEIVQFERFGFVRLDDKVKRIFIFSS